MAITPLKKKFSLLLASLRHIPGLSVHSRPVPQSPGCLLFCHETPFYPTKLIGSITHLKITSENFYRLRAQINKKRRWVFLIIRHVAPKLYFDSIRGPLLILFMEMYYEKYLFNLWPEKESGCNCSATSTVIGWKLITTLISSNHSSFL